MSEPVYVVRLTEEQREELGDLIEHLSLLRYSLLNLKQLRSTETFGDAEVQNGIYRLLSSARPEHPERQAALELLYAIAIAIDWPQSSLNGYREFINALANVRALEPKP